MTELEALCYRYVFNKQLITRHVYFKLQRHRVIVYFTLFSDVLRIVMNYTSKEVITSYYSDAVINSFREKTKECNNTSLRRTLLARWKSDRDVLLRGAINYCCIGGAS